MVHEHESCARSDTEGVNLGSVFSNRYQIAVQLCTDPRDEACGPSLPT